MALNLSCNDCGISLIVGYSWREVDVRQGRYICNECDNERRAKHLQDNMVSENKRKLQWYHITRHKNNSNFKYAHSVKGRYSKYKYSAKVRDIIFRLIIKDVASIIKKPCKYCGYQGEYYNGIDRVDSELGYTKNNCVSCCAICNRMKLNYKVEDFIGYCEKITNNQKVMSH